MPATRKQVDANRRTGHLRRASKYYQYQAVARAKAREWYKIGRTYDAHTCVMLARGWGKSARHALALAAKYEAR